MLVLLPKEIEASRTPSDREGGIVIYEIEIRKAITPTGGIGQQIEVLVCQEARL